MTAAKPGITASLRTTVAVLAALMFAVAAMSAWFVGPQMLLLWPVSLVIILVIWLLDERADRRGRRHG